MYQESLFYWNSSFAGQFWQYVPISTVLQKWDKQICLIYNMYKLFSNAIGYKHVYTPLVYRVGIFICLVTWVVLKASNNPFTFSCVWPWNLSVTPFCLSVILSFFCLSMGLIWDRFDFFSRVMTLKFLLYFERRFPLWLFICDNYIIMYRYLYIILI